MFVSRRLRYALAFATAAFLLMPVARAQDAVPSPLLAEFAWRPIGPANMGGRVDDVEAVESNPAIIYVGAATSGVWKTENNGTTWLPVFDAEPNLSIGDLAIAPSNSSVVWVGTGEANNRQSTSYGGGIFKSTDAGQTWTAMGLADSGAIPRIVIDPKNPDIVYVAVAGDLFKASAERGLYKTTDGGKTWTKSKFIDDDTGFGDVQMDPSNNQVLIAASYQRRRATWGFNGGGPGSALWKTTDAGRTWKKIEGGGLPAYGKWGRVGLGFSRSSPNVVYAMIEPGPQGFGAGRGTANQSLDPNRAGIWRSTDRGVTWTLVSNNNGRAMYFSQVRVDPRDPNTIFTLQRSLEKSTDGGRTFTVITESVLSRLQDPISSATMVPPFTRDYDGPLPASHPDHHGMWIDPSNTRHIVLGHDGGVDFSYDGGRTWQFQDWMPMGQFYGVAVDMRQPYNVYGGAQDNGWWGGPSRVRNNGGITNAHWFELAAGDGYHTLVDPTDPDIVYGSVSGNGGQHIWRFNLKTGEQKYIRPTPPKRVDDPRPYPALPSGGNIATQLPPNEVARYNWVPGFAMSPHDPRTIYMGSNRLYISHDRGDSWVATKDLSKQIDRDTLSIMGVPGSEPMTAKNDGVAGWGTIVEIAESPVTPGVIWIGTDDGNVQVSRDGGTTWDNVGDNAMKFPQPVYASALAPSHFDAGTAYIAFDGHLIGDFKPYVFRTTDFGKTWTDVAASLPPRGNVNTLYEDRFNHNLLFAGTEFGLYISIDGAKSWTPFMNNLPATRMDAIVVHPREQDLVLATHGRSFLVLDDITPLQQLTDAVLAEPSHLFRPRPAVLWKEDKTAWHGGADEKYRAKNPPDAILSYYLKSAAGSPAKIEVIDQDGTLVREFEGPRAAGIHRVTWDLRKLAPAPPANRPAGLAEPTPRLGERIDPGSYIVQLTVDGTSSRVPLMVQPDPDK